MLAFAQTPVVGVVSFVLGVPLVVVARSQMDERFISGVSHEVVKVPGCSAVPAVLTVTSPVSSSPVVASVAIARSVLLVHVVPQALHRVAVQDVGEGEGEAELCRVREILTVVPALGPVHHQGVGANVGSVSTLSAPVGGGRGGSHVSQNFSRQTDLLCWWLP